MIGAKAPGCCARRGGDAEVLLWLYELTLTEVKALPDVVAWAAVTSAGWAQNSAGSKLRTICSRVWPGRMVSFWRWALPFELGSPNARKMLSLLLTEGLGAVRQDAEV